MGNICGGTAAAAADPQPRQQQQQQNNNKKKKHPQYAPQEESSSPVDQVKSIKLATPTATSPNHNHHLKNIFAKPLHLLLPTTYAPPVYPKTRAQELFLQEALQQNVLLQHNNNATSARPLVLAFEPFSCPKNTVMIRQGDEGDYFYILEQGRVVFEVNGKVVGHASQKGASFGELSLLYASPRAATCRAETDCTLWRLDPKAFRFILQQETTKADDEKRTLLQKIDLFQELDKDDDDDDWKNQLLKVMCPRSFQKGERLVTKGQAGTDFFILGQGVVKLTDISVGNVTYPDLILDQPGEYFGERALVTLEPRAANAVAQTNGMCWTVQGDAFCRVLGGNLHQVVLRAQDKRILQSIMTTEKGNVSSLDSSQLVALADMIVDVTYPKKGTVVCTEGTKQPATLYLVRSGKVQVTSDSNTDDQYSQDTVFTKGGFFGQDQFFEIGGEKQEDHNGTPTMMTKQKYTVTVLENDTTLGQLKWEHAKTVMDTTTQPPLLVGKTPNSANHATASTTHISSIQQLHKHTILGAGTFGQVWLVTTKTNATDDKNEKTPYALKIQSKHELIQQSQAHGVVNEKNIMSLLQRNNKNSFVISMISSFQDDAMIYMLLQLVQGGELYSVLHTSDRDGVSETSAKFYAAGILEGLTCMHRQHILYRDLKPENVLVDQDGYPVLIDLGFAKVVKGKTFTLCGTPLYIAPEVILNRGHDKGVDHWSFGVLIYEMMTGYTPFYQDGMDQMELFRAIINAKFNPPPAARACMSRQALSMIGRFLAKDPPHRLGSRIIEIYRDAWFEGSLNFEAYRRRRVPSPWKPKIRDPLDSSNFDSWDHLTDKSKQEDPPLSAKDQAIFMDF